VSWKQFINDFQQLSEKIEVCWIFVSLTVVTYLRGLESNERDGIRPPKDIGMLFSI